MRLANKFGEVVSLIVYALLFGIGIMGVVSLTGAIFELHHGRRS